MNEHVEASGHENVTAEHASTFEVTSDEYLTPAGDCILGIEADRVPADFDEDFVERCRDTETEIVVTLTVDELTEQVVGKGHPDLSFESTRSMVCRTSEYVDERTVAVGMERAASELDRELVERLADGASLSVTLTARSG